jgi:hypothetical protein
MKTEIPLCKRGRKGDFVIVFSDNKISPHPSFPKRGIS